MAEFPPDEELLDFDPAGYAEWDRTMADRLLIEEPVLYRNHLAIARWLQQWADRMEEHHSGLSEEEEWSEGHNHAVRDITAHLRQGDFVPGRAMYERS